MPKRGENIFKRKDGRYEARYVKERDSKGRVLKYGYVYDKSYRNVKIKREQIVKNYEANKKKNDNLECDFKGSINNWLETKLAIKDSSYTNYYSIINSQIVPFFKDIKLDSINENIAIKFIKCLQDKKLSNKRIKDILLVLKQFLKHENINVNFEIPKVVRKKIVTLKEQEVEIIERKTFNSREIKDFAILLVLFSGIRIGELCALKWEDIDFERNVIHISKTVIRIKNKDCDGSKAKTKIIIDVPKTEKSIRDIPIHKFLIDKLKDLRKDADNYLLTGNSDYLTTQKYYFHYQKFLKKCEIENYNFHVLRHTFATRALLNGIDVKTLSEILGHSSVKITLDLYVHIKDEEKLNQINKIPMLSL